MRKLLTILLVFSTVSCFTQSYVLQWTTSGQPKDTVQQSADSVHFSTGYIVNGGIDSLIVPNSTYYYRVKADTTKSNVLLVTSVLSITPVHGKSKKTATTLSMSAYQEGSNLKLKITSPKYQEMGINLTTVSGQRMLDANFYLQTGDNIVTIPIPNMPKNYCIITGVTYFETIHKIILIK